MGATCCVSGKSTVVSPFSAMDGEVSGPSRGTELIKTVTRAIMERFGHGGADAELDRGLEESQRLFIAGVTAHREGDVVAAVAQLTRGYQLRREAVARWEDAAAVRDLPTFQAAKRASLHSHSGSNPLVRTSSGRVGPTVSMHSQGSSTSTVLPGIVSATFVVSAGPTPTATPGHIPLVSVVAATPAASSLSAPPIDSHLLQPNRRPSASGSLSDTDVAALRLGVGWQRPDEEAAMEASFNMSATIGAAYSEPSCAFLVELGYMFLQGGARDTATLFFTEAKEMAGPVVRACLVEALSARAVPGMMDVTLKKSALGKFADACLGLAVTHLCHHHRLKRRPKPATNMAAARGGYAERDCGEVSSAPDNARSTAVRFARDTDFSLRAGAAAAAKRPGFAPDSRGVRRFTLPSMGPHTALQLMEAAEAAQAAAAKIPAPGVTAPSEAAVVIPHDAVRPALYSALFDVPLILFSARHRTEQLLRRQQARDHRRVATDNFLRERRLRKAQNALTPTPGADSMKTPTGGRRARSGSRRSVASSGNHSPMGSPKERASSPLAVNGSVSLPSISASASVVERRLGSESGPGSSGPRSDVAGAADGDDDEELSEHEGDSEMVVRAVLCGVDVPQEQFGYTSSSASDADSDTGHARREDDTERDTPLTRQKNISVAVCITARTKRRCRILGDRIRSAADAAMSEARGVLAEAIRAASIIDGCRSTTLVPLFLLEGQALLLADEATSAVRTLQRCLGITRSHADYGCGPGSDLNAVLASTTELLALAKRRCGMIGTVPSANNAPGIVSENGAECEDGGIRRMPSETPSRLALSRNQQTPSALHLPLPAACTPANLNLTLPGGALVLGGTHLDVPRGPRARIDTTAAPDRRSVTVAMDAPRLPITIDDDFGAFTITVKGLDLTMPSSESSSAHPSFVGSRPQSAAPCGPPSVAPPCVSPILPGPPNVFPDAAGREGSAVAAAPPPVPALRLPAGPPPLQLGIPRGEDGDTMGCVALPPVAEESPRPAEAMLSARSDSKSGSFDASGGPALPSLREQRKRSFTASTARRPFALSMHDLSTAARANKEGVANASPKATPRMRSSIHMKASGAEPIIPHRLSPSVSPTSGPLPLPSSRHPSGSTSSSPWGHPLLEEHATPAPIGIEGLRSTHDGNGNGWISPELPGEGSGTLGPHTLSPEVPRLRGRSPIHLPPLV